LAHELNQPLGAILSNAQAARMFLDRDPADLAEVGESLDAIIRNDQRASEIIRALRRMLVKEDVPKRDLAIETVVDEAMKLLGSELIVRRTAIRTEIANGCPHVTGDRIQLQQVLVNLVINACDAMEGNAPAERVVIVRTKKTDRGVRVSVEDHGKGVPPALLEGNFTPFVTTKTHGMGLGLAVCSSIIANHGGHLRVTNKESGGAIFTFELPASVRHAHDRESQPA
jgi:C4-dicarboxylate-specific signal transduction histidine kinase